MIVLWLPLAAAAGLIVASVIWTIADKQIRGSGPNLEASCLYCGENRSLRFWLPLSWLANEGRCPHCGESDASSRKRWEFVVAGYFGVALALLDTDSRSSLAVATLPLLLILAVDLKVQAVFLHDCYLAVIVGLFLGLLDSASQAAGAMTGMAISIVVCAFFLLITRWVFRSLGVRTMPIGLTDLYVAAAVGAIVRFDGLLPALVVAVVGAALYGILVPIFRPQSRARLAPFGPFLCIGGLVALLI